MRIASSRVRLASAADLIIQHLGLMFDREQIGAGERRQQHGDQGEGTDHAASRSIARNFALRARGLARISAASGAFALPVNNRNFGAAIAGKTCRIMPRRARRPPRGLRHETLDDAIFQRMKTHHHQPAAGRQ
jgi:hypothetical protein